MPRGDRRGPNGAGPMTGRRMGFCTGHNQPGFVDHDFDMHGGYGRGNGYGHGGYGRGGYGRGGYGRGGYGMRGYGMRGYGMRGNRYFYEGQPEDFDEKAIIKDEITILKTQLANLEKELERVESSETKE